MLVYLTLAFCAAVIGVLVYRYDLYDREPWPLIVVTVAIGAAMMWLAGLVQVAVLSAAGTSAAANWDAAAAALAAGTEEAAKLLTVGIIALAFRRCFNDPMDGLVYGAFAGLGAALEESVILLSHEHSLTSLPPAEAIRLTGHLLMGGIGGFGLGMARFRRPWWPGVVAGCYLAAFLLHFLWDVIAFRAGDLGRMTGGLLAGAMAVMLSGLFLFRALVGVASKQSSQIFRPEAGRE